MTSTEWRFDVIVNPDLLRAHMEFKKLSCRQLAKRVGCSHSTIGHYRTGRSRNVSTERAHKIADALDAPLSPLFLPTTSTVLPDTARS